MLYKRRAATFNIQLSVISSASGVPSILAKLPNNEQIINNQLTKTSSISVNHSTRLPEPKRSDEMSQTTKSASYKATQLAHQRYQISSMTTRLAMEISKIEVYFVQFSLSLVSYQYTAILIFFALLYLLSSFFTLNCVVQLQYFAFFSTDLIFILRRLNCLTVV